MAAGSGRGGHGGDSAFFEELTSGLCEYAEKRFELAKDVDGSSLHDHLDKVYEQTGEIPEELELPEVDSMQMDIWEKFLSLHRGRGHGINGPCPLSYQDILAWTQVTRRSLEPWEVEVVMAVDQTYLRVARSS